MPAKTPASLHGIHHSNRNFSDPYYWGKNQFNSAFPVALACYMRDNKMPALYIEHKKKQRTRISDLSFDEVFGTCLPNDKLYFSFEAGYEPYTAYLEDTLEHIDLVVHQQSDRNPIRPLEIKLTTLPDDATSGFEESKYGSELVIRSPTMRYMALSMGASCKKEWKLVREIFEPACKRIRDWSNLHEVLAYQQGIYQSLEVFLEAFHRHQKPFLLQPIWKTIGKAPLLADHCLDIFVWSDFALARLFMDGLQASEDSKITRPQRAALRLARFLYELSKDTKVYQKPIYDGMTFDTLNDKEFAVSGRKTNVYMSCARLLSPAVTKGEIKKMILGGGQRYLSPERRFDSILFFSKDLFDE